MRLPPPPPCPLRAQVESRREAALRALEAQRMRAEEAQRIRRGDILRKRQARGGGRGGGRGSLGRTSGGGPRAKLQGDARAGSPAAGPLGMLDGGLAAVCVCVCGEGS